MQALNVSPGCDQLPSGSKLVDGFGRAITYLRLAVTDRCNLRCRYCTKRIPYSPIHERQRYGKVVQCPGICWLNWYYRGLFQAVLRKLQQDAGLRPRGFLRPVFMDNGTLDLRALLRDEATTDNCLAAALGHSLDDKPKNGYIAEENSQGGHASMASIGG